MTDFFYQIVVDAINYDDKERMAELYALQLSDMRDWCNEWLDLAGDMTERFREAVLNDLFARDSDFPYELWRYIQDHCAPDPDTESDEDSA